MHSSMTLPIICGIMLDMYRHPDKLTKATERLMPIQIRMGASASKRMGKPVVMLMLHKGLDSFMSDEQYMTLMKEYDNLYH